LKACFKGDAVRSFVSDQGGFFFQFEYLGIIRQFRIEEGYEPFYFSNITGEMDAKIIKVEDLFEKFGR